MSRRKRRSIKQGTDGRETDMPSPGYIKRSIPPYELLSDSSLTRIERYADRLLAEVGVEFREHPFSVDLLRQSGASVDGERVRFEPGMCREIIRTNAPTSFVQLARNPHRSVTVGEDCVVFSPFYGTPFVHDLDGERRYATLQDFNDFVKLCQITPVMHHSGGTICEPVDVPTSKRHLEMLYGHIRYCDKPYMGAVTSGWQAEDSLQMTELLFGREILDHHCCVLGLINPISPLMYDASMLEVLRVYARRGQGTVITPFVMAGASSPVTPAAMVAQVLAEAMAGMTLTQLIRPGAPMIFGLNTMGLDMRSGAPVRFDESWKVVLAAGQLARRLGVPYRCGGASSTAKIPDVHAGMEGATYLTYTLLSGVNFLIHATGTLEGGLCASYEKFVLDCELLKAQVRMLSGIDTTDDAFAMSAYAEVGPAGTFLVSPHTLARYRDAIFSSKLMDASSFEQWNDAGAGDATTHANTLVRSMLADYEAPALDPEIDKALLAFIARRKSELPDSYA